MTLRHRGLGLAIGMVADQVFADPQKHHPVSWFGSWATRVEETTHADNRAAGTMFAALAVAPVLVGGLLVERVSARHRWMQVAATAVATWAALGARRLADEGRTMADRLEDGDLEAAREQLPNLCGRDPRCLDAEDLGRATVESMAENTNDAGVCTIFWGALAGVPGILTHRALNTLGRFGTASARTDDAAAWVPARLTGALACVCAPLVGGDTPRAWRIMRRDGARHPSPNGGWCESAWAGAFGVQLGGENRYGDRVESRPTLGDGPRPAGSQVRRAATLVTVVTAAATGLLAGALIVFGGGRK